jgi:hypothetical protein
VVVVVVCVGEGVRLGWYVLRRLRLLAREAGVSKSLDSSDDTHIHTLSLSLSLSLTHTHTHTHVLA